MRKGEIMRNKVIINHIVAKTVTCQRKIYLRKGKIESGDQLEGFYF